MFSKMLQKKDPQKFNEYMGRMAKAKRIDKPKTKNIFEDDKPKNKTFFSLNKQVDKIYDKIRYFPKKKRRVMKI